MTELERLRDEVAQLRQRVDSLGDLLSVRHLEVERITLRERDGTTRAVMASRSAFPDRVQIGGVEIDHSRPVAGLLFFNDDGDECGGLVFAGSRATQGQAGSLTFDRRDGDQVVQVFQEDQPSGRTAGVVVVDQPDVPLPQMLERLGRADGLEGDARAAALADLREEGLLPSRRVFVGRNQLGHAVVELHDGEGRPRLRLAVSDDGTQRIEAIDEGGTTVWAFPPGASDSPE